MGIIAWIVFGATAGWLTSKLAGINENQGWAMNIALGIAGVLIGGFLWRRAFNGSFSPHFNLGSLLIAILGGLLLSYFANALEGRA